MDPRKDARGRWLPRNRRRYTLRGRLDLTSFADALKFWYAASDSEIDARIIHRAKLLGLNPDAIRHAFGWDVRPVLQSARERRILLRTLKRWDGPKQGMRELVYKDSPFLAILPRRSISGPIPLR